MAVQLMIRGYSMVLDQYRENYSSQDWIGLMRWLCWLQCRSLGIVEYDEDPGCEGSTTW